jgi:cytoskeleton protein RodZ
VTAIPERLAPLAQQALPPVPKPVAVADAPAAQVPAPLPATQAVQSDPAPAVAPISPTSAAAALIREPTPSQPAVAAMAPPSDGSRIVLRASADAWMQVKDRSGTVLLNRILRAGETWPVPRQDNLMFTTGNAGGTEIIVDGVTTPSLGGAGAVRRDLPLDPDVLKNGKVATAAPALAAVHGRQ